MDDKGHVYSIDVVQTAPNEYSYEAKAAQPRAA